MTIRKSVQVFFILGLMASIVVPSFSRSAEALLEGVEFRATATTDETSLPEWWYCGNYSLDVEVEEILEDPLGELTIGQEITLQYENSHNFGTDDHLQVHGTSYLSGGPLQCAGRVVIGGEYGSPGDSITFTSQCATHHFFGEVLRRTDAMEPIEYGFIIRVTEVLAETPDFNIDIGDEIVTWAEGDAIGTPFPWWSGDIVEVLGHSSMVSCVPFDPACDTVGIRVEVTCDEYLEVLPPTMIHGRIFVVDLNNVMQPLPPNVSIDLVAPIMHNQEGPTVPTQTLENGRFRFTFDDVSDLERCYYVYNVPHCTDAFGPGKLQIDWENSDGYRAKTSVYYLREDFEKGKSIYVEVYVYVNRFWWNDNTRHETLTLFPPDGLDTNGNYNGTYDGIPDIIDYYPRPIPLLLVHGHGGKAEYWRGLREPLAKNGVVQTWEVFYPGTEYIVQGAAVLKEAIDLILKRYNTFPPLDEKVDIVAHSMGGPVSRAYVAGIAQSENNEIQPYTPKVRRLLMLATPNFGVLHAARLIGNDTLPEDCSDVVAMLLNQNPSEPAIAGLAMGSSFFTELRDRGLDTLEKALVAVGTRSAPSLCVEALGQNDWYIGASSASLLSYGYPLAVLHRDHSQMRGMGKISVDPILPKHHLPQPEQDDDDDPHNDVRELINLIEAFFYDTSGPQDFTDLYIKPDASPPNNYEIWGMRGTEHLERAPSTIEEWQEFALQWNGIYGHPTSYGPPHKHHDLDGVDLARGNVILQLPISFDPDIIVRGARLDDGENFANLRKNPNSGLWYIDNGLMEGSGVRAGEYDIKLLLIETSTGIEAPEYRMSTVAIKPLQTVSVTKSISEMQAFSFSYDLNNSGTVDAGDIQAVSGDWRCKCGDECYDPEHDFDYDCDTDIVEIMEVVSHWEGEGEPIPTSWTQKNPTIHPSARFPVPMVYSTDQNSIILFGGGLGSGQFSNETWSYDGVNWTQLSPTTSPAPRASHAMAYDSSRNRVVLFGGWDNSTLRQDTWEFDGTNWTEQSTTNSPPARHHHAMAYDSARRVAVLFGGDLPYPGFFDDTWEYDGDN